jgi:hypothetical protein
MGKKPLPAVNLCHLLGCAQIDAYFGLAPGTTGTPAMLDAEGNWTGVGNGTLSDGTPVSVTIVVSAASGR